MTTTAAKVRSSYLPEAGDIIWLELDPATGHEQAGRRPCLVLSEMQFAIHTGYAIVCPITKRIRGLPFEIALDAADTGGVILCHQVKSVDLSARFPKFIEKAPADILQRCRDYVQTLIGNTT